jgi:outer membrane receptor for ferrienterochelin and colicins
MEKNKFAVLLGAVLCSCIYTSAANKNKDVNDSINLDEIVVTANRHQTLRREAPALINVINKNVFVNSCSPSLSDALPFQIGVRVEDNCETCGFKQARINGLDGHYSQVLIDSQPVFSSLSSVYGIELVPENLIERVEVMRGGGSALYGSSAVGGTINIITRQPTTNSASLSHTLTSFGGSSDYDNITEVNASATTENHHAGIYVYGQYRHRDGYDRNSDGLTELPKMNVNTFGTKAFMKVGEYQHLNINMMHTESTHRGGGDLNLEPHEASLAEMAKHIITQGGITYDMYTPDGGHHLSAYTSMMSTNRDSYSGGKEVAENDNPSLFYANTTDLLWASGVHFCYNIPQLWFMPSELTVGAEYSYDHLHDKFIGFNSSQRQIQRIESALLQNEWKNEQCSILLGVRADKDNLVDHIIVSPRINLRYNPTHNVNFRLGYSDGFRAPQTFDEDLHVDMAGGERFRIRNVSGLKEERSHSLTASADLYHHYENMKTELTIEAFYTRLENAFAIRTTGDTDADGSTIRERYNGSKANVSGINMEYKADIANILDVSAGFTMQCSHYSTPQKWSDEALAEKRMFRSPDNYGYYTIDLHPSHRLTLSTSGTYTGSMLVAHAASSGTRHDIAVNTREFFTADLRISYDILLYGGTTLQASAGIKNIFDSYQQDFDKGLTRDSDYIYGPSLPRSYFASLRLSL